VLLSQPSLSTRVCVCVSSALCARNCISALLAEIVGWIPDFITCVGISKAAAKARSVAEENVKRVLSGKGRPLNEKEEETNRMARRQNEQEEETNRMARSLADFRAPESGCGQEERSVVSIGSETGANGSFDEEWVLVD